MAGKTVYTGSYEDFDSLDGESIKELVLRLVSCETLSDDEREYIFRLAKTEWRVLPDRPWRLGDLLTAVALINTPDSESIIAPYLDRFDNPFTIGFALKAVGLLGLTYKYKTLIFKFICGGAPENDRYGRIGSSSFACVGSYLRTHHDKDFAGLVIDYVSRPPFATGVSHGDRSTIFAARRAACDALGADVLAVISCSGSDQHYVDQFLAGRRDG